ncbi:MAG: FHA domain-containing protein [Candidatus Binataceae bacterium]
MIKCNECGYENMDGLDYCDGCGSKLNQAAASPEASALAPAAAPEAPTGAIGTPPNQPEPGPTQASAGAEPQPVPEPEPLREPAFVQHEAQPLPATPEPAPAVPQPAAATPPAFKAKLKIVRGGRQGHEFPLEGGNNLVGRWDPETGAFPEVDLEADDPEAKISRKHALIRIESGKITLEDIGSLNGTYVNRQPRLAPGAPHDLKDGDEIIIGKTFFKVVIEPVS